MSEIRRIDQELADALGLAQRIRTSVAEAIDRDPRPKLARRLALVDADVGALQERLNAVVVADPEKRARLTSRARTLRDAEERLGPDADLLDALQALSADAAYAVAQWRVLKPLAKAAKDAEARVLVKDALPASERQLAFALDACVKQARRAAAAQAN